MSVAPNGPHTPHGRTPRVGAPQRAEALQRAEAPQRVEALQRLAELLPRGKAERWLRDARVLKAKSAGQPVVLRVRGPLEKRWMETHGAEAVRLALGEAALVETAPGPARTRSRGAEQTRPPLAVAPVLRGPAGEYALRMLRAFVEGGPAAAPLLVLFGSPLSGLPLLARWVEGLAGRSIFRVDLARLRAGGSRNLIPRKKLVLVEDLEQIAKRAGAQRAVALLLDEVRMRGARVLVTLDGPPATREGLSDALRSRLHGGVLLALPEPGPAEVRLQMRERARQQGRRLPGSWEDELSHLPADTALAALDLRFAGRPDAGLEEVKQPLCRMKDCAARLFEVERESLDLPVKRRSVVEARRSVMVAALRSGLAPELIARAFGIRSLRAVQEANKWVERQEKKQPSFARLLDQLSKSGGAGGDVRTGS